jgi:signal transduction histidine kinase
MEDEKKLQGTLIRRFIITLFAVAIIELILTMVSDRWVMPVIADYFFPDHEVSDHFSAHALGSYIAGSLIGSLVSFMCRILPEYIRFPISIFINDTLSARESTLFASGDGYIISRLPFTQKILFDSSVLVILLVFAIPYIVAAVRFSLVTMKEFRKIGEKRMQARKDYERKRNLMISDIAHDLRTPITTVSGYAQALVDGLVKEEDVNTYLEAIRDKAVGMNDMIQMLFDYTRVDSEGFVLTREKTDICELVRECAALVYPDAETAGFEIDVDIPERRIEQSVDRVHFKRVINNLTVNAIRHNQAGCRVGIVVFEEAGRVNIAVADNGEMIPEDKADHIFEPFFMGDESRNSKGGSGLGLSVAMKVTQMHGFRLKLIQGSILNRYKELSGYTKSFVISM